MSEDIQKDPLPPSRAEPPGESPDYSPLDYPAEPPRESISDAHRVYPGDGAAPLKDLLRTLRHIGFHGVLSLELFNRDYWKQDAAAVARTGLAKMRNLVRSI